MLGFLFCFYFCFCQKQLKNKHIKTLLSTTKEFPEIITQSVSLAGGSADHGDGSQAAGAGRGTGRAAVTAPFSVMLVQSLSCVNSWIRWTEAPQAPLSMGFSSKEYWSG